MKYTLKIDLEKLTVDKAMSGQHALELVRKDIEDNMGR